MNGLLKKAKGLLISLIRQQLSVTTHTRYSNELRDIAYRLGYSDVQFLINEILPTIQKSI